MKLGEEHNLPLGHRDAIHVPIVLAECHFKEYETVAGCWVRFIDDACTVIEPCEREFAHGVVDPFMAENGQYRPPIVVLLKPGLSGPVRHNFEVTLPERTALEKELAEVRADDPRCAECWQIRNGRLERD